MPMQPLDCSCTALDKNLATSYHTTAMVVCVTQFSSCCRRLQLPEPKHKVTQRAVSSKTHTSSAFCTRCSSVLFGPSGPLSPCSHCANVPPVMISLTSQHSRLLACTQRTQQQVQTHVPVQLSDQPPAAAANKWIAEAPHCPSWCRQLCYRCFQHCCYKHAWAAAAAQGGCSAVVPCSGHVLAAATRAD